ncbi:hypothetical protein D3C81_1510720 [compost metagenome]
MREGQRHQPGIARLTVGDLALGPLQEAPATGLEEGAQGGGVVALLLHAFALAQDVEIDHGDVDPGQPARLAQQPAVDLGLRPVQCPVVGGHLDPFAAHGLDFLEPVGGGVVAIGAAPHVQSFEHAGEGYLRFIARPAPARDHAVARYAFLCGGRGREAQVEIARLGRELAQRPHGNRVAW